MKWKWLVGGLLLVLALPGLVQNMQNVARLAQFANPSSVFTPAAGSTCGQLWLDAISDHHAGLEPTLSNWRAIMQCDATYINLVQTIYPRDHAIAAQAVDLYPYSARVWLWLGVTELSPVEAMQSFQKTVSLEPDNGLAWCYLGGTYEAASKLTDAVTAYLACCRLGDPGVNGCWGAGRNYEKLGDLPAAIAAYQRSTWPPALQRAAELKNQLAP